MFISPLIKVGFGRFTGSDLVPLACLENESDKGFCEKRLAAEVKA
jgi:hypothetical protein